MKVFLVSFLLWLCAMFLGFTLAGCTTTGTTQSIKEALEEKFKDENKGTDKEKSGGEVASSTVLTSEGEVQGTEQIDCQDFAESFHLDSRWKNKGALKGLTVPCKQGNAVSRTALTEVR